MAWTESWLKEVFLFGVDLTRDDGTAFPTAMFTQAMNNALEWLRTNVDVAIPRAEYTERHDFSDADKGEFWLLQVDRQPVREVTSLQLSIATSDVFTVPTSWIMPVGPNSNIVQVVPSAQTVGAWADAVYAIQTLNAAYALGRLPGWYKVVYEAGYDLDEIPADLLDIVGKMAAIYALHTAGDLIVGAGIASRSTSLDGASQSVNSTASATNSGYGARILAYRNEIKRDMPAIRRKYHGMPMVGI